MMITPKLIHRRDCGTQTDSCRDSDFFTRMGVIVIIAIIAFVILLTVGICLRRRILRSMIIKKKLSAEESGIAFHLSERGSRIWSQRLAGGPATPRQARVAGGGGSLAPSYMAPPTTPPPTLDPSPTYASLPGYSNTPSQQSQQQQVPVVSTSHIQPDITPENLLPAIASGTDSNHLSEAHT